MTVALYHWTCLHGAEKIDATGEIWPNPQPVLGDIELSWFTATPSAGRDALGLTSRMLSCDRMEALYRVDPPDDLAAIPWSVFKRLDGFDALADAARRLEAVRGTRPALWWLAAQPVRATRVR